MTTEQRWTRAIFAAWLACLMIGLALPAAAKQYPEPKLNAKGDQIRVEYAKRLDTLSAEVAAELPTIEADKKAAFLQARADLAALAKPKEDAAPKAHLAYQAAKAEVEAKVLAAARAILADVEDLLTGEELDTKLMQVAILRHGTPAGLAEFAQQSEQHKAFIDNLFADEALMKQVLRAGGANGGEYGEAMQVYHAIGEASQRTREEGSVSQRLALGTALHQPWLEGEEKGSVNGVVFTDHTNPDGQVARYLHYEQAYLAEELDPAFKDFTTWECRFITNDPYTNEELTWVRQMLWNFRPDHITNPDQRWRYTKVVKSDLPYCSTTHDDSLGLPQQQALALGGICGRRAFFGRFVTRAFGIPARRSTQTGHAAMNRWTPEGWKVCFGGWWSINWCGPQGGLDFYLDSQAREFPDDYMQVLRAQWIGDALGEEDVSLRHYGQGGGFWNGLAFYQKVALVEDHLVKEEEDQLAKLSAEEARLLGESDKILDDDQEVKAIEIPAEDKKITIDEFGTISLPAVACTSPKNNTEKVAFLPSWDSGMQLHYQRLGNRPEILRYTVEAPKAGKYEITAQVATVSPQQGVIFRVNRRTLVNVTLPYTKGMWEQSEPDTIELKEGRNSIMVTFRAPNRGVTIKEFKLKPVQ